MSTLQMVVSGHHPLRFSIDQTTINAKNNNDNGQELAVARLQNMAQCPLFLPHSVRRRGAVGSLSTPPTTIVLFIELLKVQVAITVPQPKMSPFEPIIVLIEFRGINSH
ncbi:hypothetical protein Ddc_01075 [Ditylenchus destructor]|nr:hypothetical protein Ddc_01075 [Ditylenchus destructor]